MKCYLDGFDYTAAMLNYDCRNTPGKGNHFLVVLELDSAPSESALRERLALLEPCLGLLSGRMRRHKLHAAPYWQNGESREIRIFSDRECDLNRCLNTPLDGLFDIWIQNRGERHLLVFRFSHLLFDGRGAECLIEALCSGDVSSLCKRPGMESPKLNEWLYQFRSGRQVQRKMIALAAAGEIAGTPADETAEAKCSVLSFSKEKTEKVMRFCEDKFGPFMLTPYLLSRLCHAYARLLDELHIPGNILVPMSIDLRGRAGIPRDAVFFNQWSLQPLLVRRELCANADVVFAELKGQIFEQMEQQLPQAYRAAARLTRIAPYSFLLSIVLKTKRTADGTFMYSFLPETSLNGNSICGCRIENLYHVPAMPPMTGVGIFMNSFRGMLNLTLSRREGIPDENALRGFLSTFLSSLKEAE